MAAGATPLDADEAAGLLPAQITTREQLDEWEAENILEGERWARSAARRHGAGRRREGSLPCGAARGGWARFRAAAGFRAWRGRRGTGVERDPAPM